MNMPKFNIDGGKDGDAKSEKSKKSGNGWNINMPKLDMNGSKDGDAKSEKNSQKILINIVEERRQKLFETPGNNAKRGKTRSTLTRQSYAPNGYRICKRYKVRDKGRI